MKRRSMLFYLVVIAMFILAACSGNESSTEENNNSPGEDEPVELRFAMWTGTPEEQETWETLAAKVTEVYPHITVKFETDSFDQYWDKLQSQVASRTAADIIALQSQRTGTFGYRGVYEPLEPYIEATPDFNIEDFEPNIMDALSYEGQLAIPYDFGPYMLYYNKDIFDKHGVEYPTDNMSWDEFLEKAIATTDGETYGFAFNSRQFDQNIPFIWQNGGGYMDENAETSLMNDPSTVEAIQFIADLHHKYNVVAPNNDPGNTTLYRDQFYDGKVAMYLDGPWNVSNVRARADFDWDITTVPAGKEGSQTYVAGSGFGIYSGSEHKDEAWKAITVMLGDEGFEYLASLGRAYPARLTATPFYEETSDEPSNINAVKVAAETSRPFRTTTNWQEADRMFVRELDNIWFNNEDVESVLARIDEQFQALLDEHQQTISQ
ncbi:sugar ABC transporter substrate-binding protein [Alkalihalobacillus oceani]|uniref:Sugar ABC transporter substrate-binding protein n=1 Tax=Halalkalibacter oceani TaxID=1653776 RepID=A0A9X2DMW4_9BACI|nr:sugar ABC transporter substrate-binding protein [Halalkalibacter oceani]MCM3712975.1 sugar ABC transporter substrate-binding protein [Halalkalibacter oceani]